MNFPHSFDSLQLGVSGATTFNNIPACVRSLIPTVNSFPLVAVFVNCVYNVWCNRVILNRCARRRYAHASESRGERRPNGNRLSSGSSSGGGGDGGGGCR